MIYIKLLIAALQPKNLQFVVQKNQVSVNLSFVCSVRIIQKKLTVIFFSLSTCFNFVGNVWLFVMYQSGTERKFTPTQKPNKGRNLFTTFYVACMVNIWIKSCKLFVLYLLLNLFVVNIFQTNPWPKRQSQMTVWILAFDFFDVKFIQKLFGVLINQAGK